ncbi:MAG TPA: MliC family protein [Thermomonas sp.]|nr:MliC family protein [Thermomonas sp.]
MTRPSPALAIALILLAGCKPGAEPPATPPADARSPAPAPAAPSAIGQQAPAEAATPSFDCSKSPGEFEQMVCKDPALAALDRQLADTFAQALAKAADKATLRASERGWIKGRDDCWKADDKAACVRDAYIVRIVDLRIQNGLVVIPSAVEYRCNDNAKPFTATFYNDEPRAVVLTWGDDQAIVPAAASASGARYAARGIEFWEHQGQARVDFFGNALTCTPAA